MMDGLFGSSSQVVARRLIGCQMTVGGIGGLIVETEAYDRLDPASHSYRGMTARNRSMFGPVGRAYIYRIYGLHWCLNLVCDATSPGSAVLIRAIEPTQGVEAMIARRGSVPEGRLCAGPGRLCHALNVTGDLDGAALDRAPFRLTVGLADPDVITGPRIGISRNTGAAWRFGLAGSRSLSRPFQAGAPVAADRVGRSP